MTQLPCEKPEIFKGRHFNHLLIIQAVRWYVTYKLSYRDVCELMAERGVTVVHTTVLRLVQCFVPAFEKLWKKYARPVGSSWRGDETYIKLKAEGVSLAQTLVRTNKYLNNIIEQDHRRVKQRCYPTLWFKTFVNAEVTLSGIELANKIKKGQFDTSEITNPGAMILQVWEAVIAA